MLFSVCTPISDEFALNVPMVIGCTSGFVPLMMRWSNKFWQMGQLPKTPDMIICIWSAACYITGGVIAIVCEVSKNIQYNLVYVMATLSIVVGIVTLLDLLVFSRQ
ncbi:Hypothetical protein NTJ_13699 [Nesidiocoris tenuis]|uniref:Uncharacterized protein n=1 Tax=Nesidiocoris tenuis TaxID=355587 RepID=A0ABN7BDI3_9HEMI|nr:Hypothetical protein NTJ_13699 [Nesidiocoris tenuis]